MSRPPPRPRTRSALFRPDVNAALQCRRERDLVMKVRSARRTVTASTSLRRFNPRGGPKVRQLVRSVATGSDAPGRGINDLTTQSEYSASGGRTRGRDCCPMTPAPDRRECEAHVPLALPRPRRPLWNFIRSTPVIPAPHDYPRCSPSTSPHMWRMPLTCSGTRFEGQKVTHLLPRVPMISENQDSLLTGKDTGNSTNFRPQNWAFPAALKTQLAPDSFLIFPRRKLNRDRIKLTGARVFETQGN